MNAGFLGFRLMLEFSNIVAECVTRVWSVTLLQPSSPEPCLQLSITHQCESNLYWQLQVGLMMCPCSEVIAPPGPQSAVTVQFYSCRSESSHHGGVLRPFNRAWFQNSEMMMEMLEASRQDRLTTRVRSLLQEVLSFSSTSCFPLRVWPERSLSGSGLTTSSQLSLPPEMSGESRQQKIKWALL